MGFNGSYTLDKNAYRHEKDVGDLHETELTFGAAHSVGLR
jgi:hypothetical protein